MSCRTGRPRGIIAAIAIVSWPPVTRVVRGEFLSLRSREFVQAAIVLGSVIRGLERLLPPPH